MAASKPARDTDLDAPVFAATITPSRSLSARGQTIVITAVGVATFIATLPFLLSGAWPVAGFGGLDVLALYIAFKANARDGRKVEELVLSRVELVVRRVVGRKRQEWHLNPLWTRIERTEDPDYGTMTLTLASRRTRLDVGAWLSPPERASLADALGEALARARRG